MPKYIHGPDDLITSHAATVEGFLKQALAKTDKATPFIEAATRFHEALQRVEDIDTLDTLLDDKTYRVGLIAAAGFSLKATTHLTKGELDEAMKKVFSTLRDKFGEAFRDEIVYRYLLTAGDTLGGSMRNYIGAEGGLKLATAIISALPASEEVKIKKSKKGKVQRIAWDNRLLIFDAKTALIGNNVDVIMLNTTHATSQRELVAIPRAYLVLRQSEVEG